MGQHFRGKVTAYSKQFTVHFCLFIYVLFFTLFYITLQKLIIICYVYSVLLMNY